MSAGGLLGTLLVKPSHKAFRPGWLLITACVVFTVCVSALALVHGPIVTAALMFTANLVVPAAIVMMDILILQQVPDEQRGRTFAGLQTVLGVGMPIGMLISGVALQYLSATTVLAAMGAWLGVAVLYAASQRALRDAQWPTAAQPSSPVTEAAPSA
jgi:predicted MFS family arabinose efflux permease